MINTTTQTYEYNPSGCREVEREAYHNFTNGKIDQHVKRLIVECTRSQPAEINHIWVDYKGFYIVVKCTDNTVYVIDFDLYELQIVREGYTEGELSDLCNHMQQCWHMLGI